MIVRILGEGQFRVGDDAAMKLTALDKDLDAAVRDDTNAAFSAALHAAVALVRASGTRSDKGSPRKRMNDRRSLIRNSVRPSGRLFAA